MRDFEQDRKICEAASKGTYVVTNCEDNSLQVELYTGKEPKTVKWVNPSEYDAKFIYSAREGWPAALDEIESLKRQLEMAAEEAAKGCCPYDANKAFALICKEDCSDDNDCSERCWLEYWRQEASK